MAAFYHTEKKTPPSRIPELNIPLSEISSDKFEKKELIDTGGMKNIHEVVDRDTTRHLAMAAPKSDNKEDWNDFIFEARNFGLQLQTTVDEDIKCFAAFFQSVVKWHHPSPL